MTAPLNNPRVPPYKLVAAVFLLVLTVVLVLVWLTFRGTLTPKTQLTLYSGRSGLVLDPGAKVTFNGVQIGQVKDVTPRDVNGTPGAQLALDVKPQYVDLLPGNVRAEIVATTVFGNKYVAFESPRAPEKPVGRVSPDVPIDVSHVTTEFNTLFETVMGIFEQVDPIKLNATLSAAADALDGLGDRFGQSLIDGNEILADVNARMPQLRYDTQKLADLSEVYADAAPELWEFLRNSLTTINTVYDERGNLDAALLAAVGFGNTGADIFERGGPYLIRAAEDLITTSRTLKADAPGLFCLFRNFHDVAPKIAAAFGGHDGYSLRAHTAIFGAGNPYVYPDNLPRAPKAGTVAGPMGKPGCWAPVTRDLWPAPYLVADIGVSLAPYNHFELGQPLAIEYVWGRQIGENTINP